MQPGQWPGQQDPGCLVPGDSWDGWARAQARVPSLMAQLASQSWLHPAEQTQRRCFLASAWWAQGVPSPPASLRETGRWTERLLQGKAREMPLTLRATPAVSATEVDSSSEDFTGADPLPVGPHRPLVPLLSPPLFPGPTIKGLSWGPPGSLSPRLTSPQQGCTQALGGSSRTRSPGFKTSLCLPLQLGGTPS